MSVLTSTPTRQGEPAARTAARLAARRRRRLGRTGRLLLVAAVCLVFLFPLAWMVLASLKSSLDISSPSHTFSFSPTLANYRNVFGAQDFLPFMWNSLLIAVVSTGLSLVLGLPAAYAMARHGMRRTGAVLLVARIIPGISLLVPWYYLFAKIGLVGSYTSLVLSHMFVGLPFITWVMINSFEALPVELEEAAQVDGLSRIQAFARIALPLSAPGAVTASILAFIFSWNNFMFALVLSGSRTKTLPVAIFNFISYATIDWGGLMAASVIITLPVVFIAVLMQRFVVSGLTGGATKG